jgi:hypothetical protein
MLLHGGIPPTVRVFGSLKKDSMFEGSRFSLVVCTIADYHSKYNPVERCWGILENHWSATLLNTLEITLEWAKTMTWKGLNPVVDGFKNPRKTAVKRLKFSLR